MTATDTRIRAMPKGVPPPEVAVIVLTYDQRETTLRFLTSFRQVEAPSHRIWLWDNGSRDGTAEAVARDYPEVRRLAHPHNLGVASGRNRAAETALETEGSPYLLFIDNDMTVEPDFLIQLWEPLVREPALAQTTGKILDLSKPERLYGAGGCRINFLTGKTDHIGWGEVDRGQYDGRDDRRPCLPSGGCLLVRSEIFRRLDGFDTLFDPYGPEDLDFDLRLRALGGVARYVPGAVVYHESEPGRTFEGGAGQASYTGNRVAQWLRFLHRHGRWWQIGGFYAFGAPWRLLNLLGRAWRQGGLGTALEGVVGGILGRRG